MRGRPTLLIACSFLAGCSREGAALDEQAPSQPSGGKLAPSLVRFASGGPSEAPREPMPRPYRRRLEAAVALNETCVSCHSEEAEEWRGSRHHQASTNAAFQEALAIEPTPFCRGCHAPESDPRKAPPTAVDDLGVGCVTCHVTEEGYVLASPSPGGGGGAGAPHLLRRSVELGRTGGCAGCHEFAFPAAQGDDDGQLMQTTVREHGRSPAAAEACTACHMPLVEGRRSHAFAQVRDPVWLRNNLDAIAERVDDYSVRVTLVQPAPGHGFPTGDLFRRLEIGCELRGAEGEVSRRAVRHLARHFEIVPGRPARQLVGDDRVFDEPVVVELDLSPLPPAPRRGPIAWWVTYQRVATIGAGTNPADAKVESAVELHGGVFP